MSEKGLKTADLIVVEQIPKITEQLVKVSAEIDKKVHEAESLVCTEGSLASVKKIRAGFSNDFKEIEKLRKHVKTTVLTPYEQFEAVYKEHVTSKFGKAKEILDKKIGDVESELLTKLTDDLKVYFAEYAESQNVTEYADFAKMMNDITRSTGLPKLKKIAKERIDSIVIGLQTIETQPEEQQAEILSVYREVLSADVAITTVAKRHKLRAEQEKLQAERAARQAAEAEAVAKVEAVAPPLAPPKAVEQDDDPIRCVQFKVTGKVSKLRELKRFLIDGGYEFE